MSNPNVMIREENLDEAAVLSQKITEKVSEAAYWEKYYIYPDKVYEWNNGELEEKAVSEFSTFSTYNWFLQLLNYYFRTYPGGQFVGLEMGFRLSLVSGTTTVRRPDLAIVTQDNPIPLSAHDKSYSGVFNMCIEAISNSTPHEIRRDIITKKAEYAESGVQEYCILDGRAIYTEFYYLGKEGLYRPHIPQNGIIQSTVLPGFQFRVDDLYRQPAPEEMVDDEVYQSFVLPSYTEEKRARKSAEQARLAAEQETFAERQARLMAEQETFAERQARLMAEQRAGKAEQEAITEKEARLAAEQALAKLKKELGLD